MRIKLKTISEELIEAQRKTVVEILQEGKTPEKLEEVAESALNFAEKLTHGTKIRLTPDRPIACGEGCFWCCCLVVQTTIPEVLRIARHLRSLPSDELTAIRTRIDHVLGDRAAGKRVLCPLLKDGKCSVYSRRPLHCQGWNSSDRDVCENYYRTGTGNTTVYAPQFEFACAIEDGVQQGLGRMGVSGLCVELLRGLAIALDNPDAEARYLQGEKLFAPAKFSHDIGGAVGSTALAAP